MKKLTGLLMLTLLLTGCTSYYKDMSDISNESTEKAKEILDKSNDRIEDVKGLELIDGVKPIDGVKGLELIEEQNNN